MALQLLVRKFRQQFAEVVQKGTYTGVQMGRSMRACNLSSRRVLLNRLLFCCSILTLIDSQIKILINSPKTFVGGCTLESLASAPCQSAQRDCSRCIECLKIRYRNRGTWWGGIEEQSITQIKLENKEKENSGGKT